MANCQGCDTPLPGRRKWCEEACRSRYRRSGGAPSASLGELAGLIEQVGLDLGDVTVKSLRVSQRTDGSPSVGASLAVRQEGPAWPVVQPAAPTIIKPVSASPKRKGTWNTAVILPDPQIGFRQLSDGSLDPFHDERAMDVAMQIVAEVKPDLIVNLGDLLDLPSAGKYLQESGFATTMQAGLDRAHRFLAQQRATAPHAKIVVMEGNHDRRLPVYLLSNAAAAFGIRRANVPDDWPVMTVPFLLRFDDLDVEYVCGYPASRYWINDRLAVAHQPSRSRGNASSALATVEEERVSLIFGHMHRQELAMRTRSTRQGARVSMAASPGCLCRITGHVPSTNSGQNIYGDPVNTAENWQQGAAVVRYEEGDGRFSYSNVFIHEGWASFEGREFQA